MIQRTDLRGMVKSVASCCPPLGNHVAHVVGLGAEKQMIGIDAAAIVAGMEHLHVVRNLSLRQHERHAMRPLKLTFTSHKLTVDISLAWSAGPEPATP